MKYELKSIGAWSFIKISFIVNLIVGFLIGLLYAMFLIPFLTLMGNAGPFGTQTDIDFSDVPIGVMIIILPIMFAFGGAVFNTIFGLIVIGVYNLAARLLGGLEFNLNPTQVAGPSPAAASVQQPEMQQTEMRPTYAAPPPPPPRPSSRPVQPERPPDIPGDSDAPPDTDLPH